MNDNDLSNEEKLKMLINIYSHYVPKDICNAINDLIDSIGVNNINNNKHILSFNLINQLSILSNINNKEIKEDKLIQTDLLNINNNELKNKNNRKEYENEKNEIIETDYPAMEKALKESKKTIQSQDKIIKELQDIIDIQKHNYNKKKEILLNEYKKIENNYNIDDIDDINNNSLNNEFNDKYKPPLYPKNNYNK